MNLNTRTRSLPGTETVFCDRCSATRIQPAGFVSKAFHPAEVTVNMKIFLDKLSIFLKDAHGMGVFRARSCTRSSNVLISLFIFNFECTPNLLQFRNYSPFSVQAI
jgi:hypothetical protein